MNIFKSVVMGIGILILLIAIALGSDYLGQQWFKIIEPMKEDARHEVFKKTRSYNEAKLQELSRYRLQYLTSKDPIAKEAIASTIRHTFAEYDESQISSAELRSFIKKIKYGEY